MHAIATGSRKRLPRARTRLATFALFLISALVFANGPIDCPQMARLLSGQEALSDALYRMAFMSDGERAVTKAGLLSSAFRYEDGRFRFSMDSEKIAVNDETLGKRLKKLIAEENPDKLSNSLSLLFFSLGEHMKHYDGTGEQYSLMVGISDIIGYGEFDPQNGTVSVGIESWQPDAIHRIRKAVEGLEHEIEKDQVLRVDVNLLFERAESILSSGT